MNNSIESILGVLCARLCFVARFAVLVACAETSTAADDNAALEAHDE